MKVLLCKNVPKVGQIGEVVEVTSGYARNYLLPGGLAVAPTQVNLKSVQVQRQAYLGQLAKERAELQARAKVLDGKDFTIVARANKEGHLYGSVGPAQVAAAMAKDGIFVEPEHIVLDEPIRRLDKYQVKVRFAEDVEATIGLWVVPPKEPDQDHPPGEAEAVPEQAPEQDEPG